MDEKPRIAMITGLASPENYSLFEIGSRLINILEPLSSELTWLITNRPRGSTLSQSINIKEIESRYVDARDSLLKDASYRFWHQAKVALTMLKLVRATKVDVFIFAFGSDLFILPILLGRLMGKKVIIRSDGRPSVISLGAVGYPDKPSKIKIALGRAIEGITYTLASRIVSEFSSMVESQRLYKYSDKTDAGYLYVDTSVFHKTKELAERSYAVGYAGRLDNEKGALEFAQCLPPILNNKQNRAIVIGNGELRDEIKETLAKNRIQGRVELSGWLPHRELPQLLNEIKLLVVPSYREGLPNIILESIACGTPVLAMPVGGIPEVIRDGETGFTMEDNSPECIARNIVRAMNHPDLEQITKKAHAFIEKEYSYETAVERYRDILARLKRRH